MGGYTCKGEMDVRASGVYNCDDATRTNQVDSRQRRVAPCDGVRNPSRLCVGPMMKWGIARAGVLRMRSCRVACACVHGRREAKTRKSTRGPGCRCATRKAVIVDRVDYFLYFGAIMLYAPRIAASLLMEYTVFTFARIAVHDCDN